MLRVGERCRARPGELERVRELLSTLPRDALLAGPELLFELTQSEARAALAKLLARRGVPLGALVAKAQALAESDLDWVQTRREGRSEAQPLTAALLSHPLPMVRATVMNRLSPREIEAHRALLLKALGDAAPASPGRTTWWTWASPARS